MSESAKPFLAGLSEDEREEALARYQVIAPLIQIAKPTSNEWQDAAQWGGCSVRTLKRWVKRFRRHGLSGLARKRRRDRGQRHTPAEIQRLIEALYLEHGHRSYQTVHHLVCTYAEEHNLPTPSYTVVRGICHALPADVVCMAREGAQAWRDQFEPILRFESSRPNECWQIDHCQLDILVVDLESGRVLGRPWLTLVLDTYSRAVMGYHLSLKTPNSRIVCLALRHAILKKPFPEWLTGGIPEKFHLDRGPDFTSNHLEQVAADLGIKLSFATAYLARAKGKVERFFETLNDGLWCELPGYVGSNVQDRPAKVEPSLTLREVEGYFAAYVLSVYHQRQHATTEEAPLVRWQQVNFTPRLPESPRQLDILLMVSQLRLVRRDGIHLHLLCYWNDELVTHIGQQVRVRYDRQNMATVVVYCEQQFICEAQAPVLSGLEISLADWRALQRRKRRSVQEKVDAYRAWLADKEMDKRPGVLSIAEVERVIALQRLTEKAQPALLPSERLALLESGQRETSHV